MTVALGSAAAGTPDAAAESAAGLDAEIGSASGALCEIVRFVAEVVKCKGNPSAKAEAKSEKKSTRWRGLKTHFEPETRDEVNMINPNFP
jgi:hypothetical protein